MKFSLSDLTSNRIKSENLYEERLSLGLNKKVQKKFDEIDPIDNISVDYVDLGLPSGTLWCKHNYGVDKSYEYGDLFSYEDAINLNLNPAHLPSKENFEELIDNCSHIWTCVHGIDGQLFVSKSNGEKIFFPAAGYHTIASKILGRGYGGDYWSSSWYTRTQRAHNMSFTSSRIFMGANFVSNSFYSVRLVISKTNESNNLGLNNKVKKKFNNGQDSKEEDLVELTEEDLISLYDQLGEVTTEFQNIHLSRSGDWSLLKGKVGNSYAKFIWEVTEHQMRFTYNEKWGQENLDAIEFWDYRERQNIRSWKNRLGGDILYYNEFREKFKDEKQNFILDWFIPTTIKILNKYPEFKHYFLRRLKK